MTVQNKQLILDYKVACLKYELKSRLDKKFLGKYKKARYGLKVLINLPESELSPKLEQLVKDLEKTIKQLD